MEAMEQSSGYHNLVFWTQGSLDGSVCVCARARVCVCVRALVRVEWLQIRCLRRTADV